IDFFADHSHVSLSILWQRREAFGRDRSYFCNNPARVRFDDLRPVAEVNLIAVVMRRIVTRRDNHARTRFKMANSERKFRHRTRSVEHERVATGLRGNFVSDFSEFRGQKTRVMSE